MIVGHKKQIDFLERMISLNNFPHAIMFEGMAGVGKKHLALYFFKKISCRKKQKEKPCESCENCLWINRLNHPDLYLTEAKGKEIQIGQIRDLVRKTSFHPYSSVFKWAIINDAHLLNQEAGNSLLKVLEEPRKDTVIILITNHPEAIFDTIRSRVQRIKFFPLKDEEISFLLKNLKCDPKKIKEIISFSFGIPGRAVEFVLNYDKIKSRKNKIKKLAEITSPQKPFHFKFQYIKEICEEPKLLEENLEIWLSYLRNLLLEKAKTNRIDISFHKTKMFIEKIEKSLYLSSKTNVDNRIIIENLIL